MQYNIWILYMLFNRFILRTNSPASSRERTKCTWWTVEWSTSTGRQETAYSLHYRRDIETYSTTATTTVSMWPSGGRSVYVRIDWQRSVSGVLCWCATTIYVPATTILKQFFFCINWLKRPRQTKELCNYKFMFWNNFKLLLLLLLNQYAMCICECLYIQIKNKYILSIKSSLFFFIFNIVLNENIQDVKC